VLFLLAEHFLLFGLSLYCSDRCHGLSVPYLIRFYTASFDVDFFGSSHFLHCNLFGEISLTFWVNSVPVDALAIWLLVATNLLTVFSRLLPRMTNSPIVVVGPLKTIVDVYLNIQLVPRSERTHCRS